MPKPDNVGVGVAVLIFSPLGQVLLLKRKGAHAADTWACPGGWIDVEDASPEGTCWRELKEELGLTPRWNGSFKFLTTVYAWHPEIKTKTVTLYYGITFMETSGKPEIKEPDKASEWKWFDPQAAVTQNDNHELRLFPRLRDVLVRI